MTTRVDRERAESVAAAALRAHGVGDADARLTATVLVSADARGKGSHGLLRLPRYVRGIEHGHVDPTGDVEVTDERGGAAAVDGGSRLGPVVATRAAVEAARRAAEYGVGAVGAYGGNHLGMLGYYTDVLADAGYVAIAMTNTEPAMPPHGGAEKVLGTNPIAVGLPTDPPFNLDLSTASLSRGAVEEAARAGESLPEGVALDADGAPTTDPEEALDGVLLPFGGAKGSGLAIAVEVLAGTLVTAATGTDVTGTYHTEDPCTKGDLFLAIDPAALGATDFEAEASAFLRSLRNGDPAANADEIRLPGERSVARDRERTAIEVDENVWSRVRDLAGE
ncbi:(R)-2-hydroxyacid dehydrogenase [Halarchaeum acidiphilum MH1-52-1]|uniref:(R)-2-hydroxyacid dehydrogenase n=1 Tax=Halarchaeum acidiphilum MH1-52-1 TaxID=1261545 RepID=U2YGH3_9EURY|nr:Ldh family oxidoreductase [Halarchaeum acidiphilum]GAD53366.1 (R)-2-hydroxyacid dehydrogenase [Halarchaeum acidiphilum MH1-52-1]